MTKRFYGDYLDFDGNYKHVEMTFDVNGDIEERDAANMVELHMYAKEDCHDVIGVHSEPLYTLQLTKHDIVGVLLALTNAAHMSDPASRWSKLHDKINAVLANMEG